MSLLWILILGSSYILQGGTITSPDHGALLRQAIQQAESVYNRTESGRSAPSSFQFIHPRVAKLIEALKGALEVSSLLTSDSLTGPASARLDAVYRDASDTSRWVLMAHKNAPEGWPELCGDVLKILVSTAYVKTHAVSGLYCPGSTELLASATATMLAAAEAARPAVSQDPAPATPAQRPSVRDSTPPAPGSSLKAEARGSGTLSGVVRLKGGKSVAKADLIDLAEVLRGVDEVVVNVTVDGIRDVSGNDFGDRLVKKLDVLPLKTSAPARTTPPSNRYPMLLLNVDALVQGTGQGYLAWTMTLKFIDIMPVGNRYTQVVTWSSERFGVYDLFNPRKLLDDADLLADDFIHSYRFANPK